MLWAGGEGDEKRSKFFESIKRDAGGEKNSASTKTRTLGRRWSEQLLPAVIRFFSPHTIHGTTIKLDGTTLATAMYREEAVPELCVCARVCVCCVCLCVPFIRASCPVHLFGAVLYAFRRSVHSLHLLSAFSLYKRDVEQKGGTHLDYFSLFFIVLFRPTLLSCGAIS